MSGLRRLATAGAVAFAAVGSAACGANFEAQTNQVYQQAAGANSRAGDVYALNVLAVAEGTRARLVGALLNKARSGDALVDVEVRAGGQSVQTSLGSTRPLRPEQLVQLEESKPIILSGDAVTAGSVIEVTLTFRNAAPVTLMAPVVDRTGPYATIPVR